MVDRPLLRVEDAVAWERWLEQHHASSGGVLLAVPRKGRGGAGPTLEEAIDVALRFGWIDSRIARIDDVHTGITFTPRGPRSGWSERNRRIAERLISEGTMRPAGLAAVELARASGRWPDA